MSSERPTIATLAATDAATGPSLARVERVSLWKAGVLLAVLLALVAVLFLTPIRSLVSADLPRWSAALRGMGWTAPLVFMLAVACLVSVGVPRLLLCPLGGMAFGFWGGLVLSQAGTFIAYYALFLFVRWGGRGFVLRHRPKLAGFTDLVRRQGVPAVILARQLPLHGWLVNLVLSLTPVRHRHFLLGTAIGLLPEAIPCTLIGAGIAHGSAVQSAGFMVLAVVGLALVWIGFAVYVDRQKRIQRAVPLPSETPL